MEFICLIGAHADLRHCPDHNMNQDLTLMQAILRSLSTDSRCILEEAVEEVGMGANQTYELHRHTLGPGYADAWWWRGFQRFNLLELGVD